MQRVLCSTGALIGRPNGRNWRLLQACANQIQCDGYELMFYESWYDQCAEILSYLKAIRLPVLAWHCEKQVGQHFADGTVDGQQRAKAHFLLNCQMASELGVPKMVLHLWNGLPSDLHIERHAEAYGDLCRTAQGYGLDLLVENVVCRWADPLTHWQALAARYPAIGFTFDTKMAAFHGQMAEIGKEEWRWLWTDHHIRHLHINDYAGGYRDFSNLRTLHLGKGRVDFPAFFALLKAVGYSGDYTLEATSFGEDGRIDFSMLNESLARIRRHLAQ